MNTSAILTKYDEYRKNRNKECDNNLIRNKIMDIRDARIRIQRQILDLESKALWEPDTFTIVDQRKLECYKSNIAHLFATEQTLRHQITI